MNLESIKNSLGIIDKIGDALTKIFKKHWWLILLGVVGLSLFGYIQLTIPYMPKQEVPVVDSVKKDSVQAVPTQTVIIEKPIIIKERVVEKPVTKAPEQKQSDPEIDSLKKVAGDKVKGALKKGVGGLLK